MRGPWRIVAVSLVIAVGAARLAAAADIDAFFGHFIGQTISASDDDSVTARDLDVTIGPTDGGAFQVDWKTTVRSDGETRKKSYAIDFEQTPREGIFASQMRRTMFGDRVPMDPMKGDPLVWARLVGDTLTVYAMRITETGTYDMQIYERTLAPGGLALTFTRYREGDSIRVVRSFLKRQPE
jgi:hypothetical protein